MFKRIIAGLIIASLIPGMALAQLIKRKDVFKENSSYIYVQTMNKNVGIGTNVPAFKLDVKGTINATGFYLNGSPLSVGGSQTPWTQNINGAGYQLVSTGNIGVGSATPGQALDVNGTARASNFSGAATGLTGTAAGLNIGGNAGTVTNGLYSSGSYLNPSWLTGVPYSILTGSVPTWNQNTTGNAATSTALAANGSNCSAGNYPLGVDASGNSEGCTLAATGTVTSSGSPVSGNIPKFSTSSNIIPAVAADIAALWSSCSGTQYLGYDGNCHTASGGSSQWNTINITDVYLPSFGNVGIGTNITNGSALTIMNGNVGIGTWNPIAGIQINNGSFMIGSNLFTVNGSGNITHIGNTTAQLTNNNLNFSNGGASSTIINSSGSSGTNMIYEGSSATNGFVEIRSTTGTGSGDYIQATGGTNGATKILTALGTGNVGIGTVAPTHLFAVGSTDQFNVNSSGNVTFGTNITGPNAFLNTVQSDSTGSIILATGGQSVGIGTSTLGVNVNGLDILGGLSVGSNLGTQSGNAYFAGSVGIGTNVPSTLLYVNGTATVNSTLTANGQLNVLGGPVQISDNTASLNYITNGNLGIGYTSSVSGKLAVNGNTGIGLNNPVNNLDVNGTVAIGSYAGVNTAPANSLIVSGNLGVGTFAPTGKLEVVGGAVILGTSQQLSFRDLNNIRNVMTMPASSTNGTLAFGQNSSYITNMTFTTSTNAGATFQFANGNVGIGSTAPGTALDVNGTARMTGFTLTGQGASAGYTIISNGSTGIGTWMPTTTQAGSIASLTTTGSSGAATFSNNVLNIPQYSGGGSSQWTTSNTNDVYLPNNGNVGIGTGQTKTAALTIMNGNVGIGTWIPGLQLDVIGTLRGVGVQSTNYAAFGPSATLGTATPDLTPTINTSVSIANNNYTDTSSSVYDSSLIAAMAVTPSADSSSYFWNHYDELRLNGTHNYLGQDIAHFSEIDFNSTQQYENATGSATDSEAWNDSSGTINAKWIGVLGLVGNSGSGTITTGVGVQGQCANYTGSGVITTCNAFDAIGSTSFIGGSNTTSTNINGLNVENMTGATLSANNHAITTAQTTGYTLYNSGSAPSYFAGNVGIGSVTPQAALDVEGTLSVAEFGGNVGIGTWLPAYGLDAGQNTIAAGQVVVNGKSQGGGIILYDSSHTYFTQFDNNQTTTLTQYFHVPTTAPSIGNYLEYASSNQLGWATPAGGTGGWTSSGNNVYQTLGGNVGIGSTFPAHALSIFGADGEIQSISSSTNSTVVDLTNTSSGGADYQFFSTGSLNGYGAGVFGIYNNTSGFADLRFYPTSGYADFGHNVGIGSTAPGAALDVVGIIRQTQEKSCATGLTTDSTGNINGCVASDESLKTGIESVKYNPDDVMKLRPVFYKWRDLSQGHDTKFHGGFIAQEVEKVFPFAVLPAGTNLKGVDPNALLAIVVSEVQEDHRRLITIKWVYGLAILFLIEYLLFRFRNRPKK